jgi:hypothetical protein
MLGAPSDEAVNGRLFRSNDVLPYMRKGDRVRHALSILVLGILMLIAGRPASAQVLNQYTTTTAGAITDLSCNQPLASQIVRTFNVPTSSACVSDRNDPVIEHRDQLVAPMAAGEKPRERVGGSAPSTRSWSIAAPITTRRPMTNPAASATC